MLPKNVYEIFITEFILYYLIHKLNSCLLSFVSQTDKQTKKPFIWINKYWFARNEIRNNSEIILAASKMGVPLYKSQMKKGMHKAHFKWNFLPFRFIFFRILFHLVQILWQIKEQTETEQYWVRRNYDHKNDLLRVKLYTRRNHCRNKHTFSSTLQNKPYIGLTYHCHTSAYRLDKSSYIHIYSNDMDS